MCYEQQLMRFSAACLLGLALIFWATSSVGQVYSSDGAPVLVGEKSVPRGLDLCNDYLSGTDYTGAPCRVVEPDRVVTRHEGIDFCAKAGTPVIAPVDGRIVWSIRDHPLRGGQVLIKTGFKIKTKSSGASKPVFIGMVHITPNAQIRKGSRVKAGQVIGTVREAGLVEIGSHAHVHFTARICDDTHKCHFDPNFLWRDGPGRVSCFSSSKPLPGGRIVAPIQC